MLLNLFLSLLFILTNTAAYACPAEELLTRAAFVRWNAVIEHLKANEERIEQTRVLPALNRVIQQRTARREAPPFALYKIRPHDAAEKTDKWKEWLENEQEKIWDIDSKGKSIQLKRETSGHASVVFSFYLDNVKYYFRPVLDGDDAPRRTLAASRIVRILGVGGSPEAYLAKLGGILGVVSAAAQGVKLGDFFYLTYPLLDRRILSDMSVVQFLFGNGDCHTGNFTLKGTKTVESFDYGFAFPAGVLNEVSKILVPFGTQLPDHYRRDTVHSLRALTPEILQRELGDHLSPMEQEGVLLRRDVILADVELRGNSVYFKK